MKKNDTVKYIGCTKEQILWGNNDDPRNLLFIGEKYMIEKVDVHSQHTKVKLYGKMGWYNSVCFEIIATEVNNYSKYNRGMDPSDIQLESTAKMFEYEKLSREIENCDDMDTLKVMCRAFIKLYWIDQETSTNVIRNF